MLGSAAGSQQRYGESWRAVLLAHHSVNVRPHDERTKPKASKELMKCPLSILACGSQVLLGSRRMKRSDFRQVTPYLLYCCMAFNAGNVLFGM